MLPRAATEWPSSAHVFEMDFATSHLTFSGQLSTVKALQTKLNATTEFDSGEIDVLFESMFLTCFRALENLLEDCFVCSMQGLPDLSDGVASRYAEPRDRQHAREMLMGAQRVLDWTKVATITKRFDVFFKDRAAPYYVGLTSNQNALSVAGDLRNHIAHNSDESVLQYRKSVIATFHPTEPLTIPSPGQLLRTTPKKGASSNRQIMSYFHQAFEKIANQVAACPAD